MVSEPIRMVRHANGVEAPPERMDVTTRVLAFVRVSLASYPHA